MCAYTGRATSRSCQEAEAAVTATGSASSSQDPVIAHVHVRRAGRTVKLDGACLLDGLCCAGLESSRARAACLKVATDSSSGLEAELVRPRTVWRLQENAR
jgi:hypothetical protein